MEFPSCSAADASSPSAQQHLGPPPQQGNKELLAESQKAFLGRDLEFFSTIHALGEATGTTGVQALCGVEQAGFFLSQNRNLMKAAVNRRPSQQGPWWLNIIKLQDIIKLMVQKVPRANRTYLSDLSASLPICNADFLLEVFKFWY